jgi:hypothetical protein
MNTDKSNKARIVTNNLDKFTERSNSLGSKQSYTGRNNYDPYGPKLRISSNSNKRKYQMYNRKNMRYQKQDLSKSTLSCFTVFLYSHIPAFSI